VLDSVFVLQEPITQHQMEQDYENAEKGPLKDVMHTVRPETGSTNAAIGDRHASVVDLRHSQVIGGKGSIVEVVSYYDNVWAFPIQKARVLWDAWIAQREWLLENDGALQAPAPGEVKEKASGGRTRAVSGKTLVEEMGLP